MTGTPRPAAEATRLSSERGQALRPGRARRPDRRHGAGAGAADGGWREGRADRSAGRDGVAGPPPRTEAEARADIAKAKLTAREREVLHATAIRTLSAIIARLEANKS